MKIIQTKTRLNLMTHMFLKIRQAKQMEERQALQYLRRILIMKPIKIVIMLEQVMIIIQKYLERRFQMIITTIHRMKMKTLVLKIMIMM